MKSVKFVLVAAAAFVGLSSAIASTSRVTFRYVQTAPNVYQKLAGTYVSSKCSQNASLPCSYTTTIDLGNSTTKATLTAAGATATGGNKLYI
ncbi:hypothetical protein [Chitinophaga arvensicola]|uniref:Uncharacterized protein n=1 Tax=Chitinophaga arvensicola TaxID=29529 RepID=A0A1I0S771_9BACT|nr:hypothetical protein [Chitinophaga arvensicola]SEW51594.1 hypothetical protein SAMN04488122_4354 [Chitinophaga arvensicola]